eukprot:m.33513 g.33513  ORF g.33513 m.33513 type:complete len:57 (+) comp9635_c0_seq1:1232-1402(+)
MKRLASVLLKQQGRHALTISNLWAIGNSTAMNLTSIKFCASARRKVHPCGNSMVER